MTRDGRAQGLGLVGGLAAVLVGASPVVARAELALEATAVAERLVADGALVDHAAPRFMQSGDVAVLRPLEAISSSDDCVTLVLLGARGTEFAVTRSAEGRGSDPTALIDASLRDASSLEAANEGLYVHTACGAGLEGLSTVVVRMRSPRAALEVVVARSQRSPRSVDALLLERSRGVAGADPPAFEPLAAGAIDDRRARAADRAKARGATNLASVTMQSSATGAGEFDLKVSRGCHVFDVLSDAPSADLDATLKSAEGEHLAVDDAESPDAHLETCVAEVGDVVLQFSGAGVSSAVSVMDAVFAWPRWVTDRWGLRAATSLARVVFTGARAPAPTSPPIAEVIGGPGTMVFHPTVEPGRCYLAALAITRGASRGLRLTATASTHTSIDQAGLPGDALTITFCSEDQDRARVQVEAPSLTNAWVLSIYPIGGPSEVSP